MTQKQYQKFQQPTMHPHADETRMSTCQKHGEALLTRFGHVFMCSLTRARAGAGKELHDGSSMRRPRNKSSLVQAQSAVLHLLRLLHLMTSSWSEQEVALWLQEQGFGDFEDAFVSNNIDGRAIVNLSKEDLEDLGVKAIGKRAALVAAIVECFGKCAANKVEAAPAATAAAWAAQPLQHESAEDDGNYLANERIKLFIGGLTDSISKEMLQQELQQHATVDEVIVLMNPATGTSKGSGFAFVVGKRNAETLMYVVAPPIAPSPARCRCVL